LMVSKLAIGFYFWLQQRRSWEQNFIIRQAHNLMSKKFHVEIINIHTSYTYQL